MSKDEALRLALEALGHFEKAGLATLKTIDAITAIKQALEETPCVSPEPEPVATVYEGAIAKWNLPEKFTGFLYTSPPKREPLTDEEADELVQRFARYELLRAIEAKLKAKNGFPQTEKNT